MTSARFTPAATTSRTTSPGPATGSGTSATCSISGPPGEDTTTARTLATLPLPPPPARRTEVHDRGRTREPSAAIMHFGPGSRGRGGPRCMIAAALRRGEEVLGEGEVGGGVEVERGAGADRHAGQAQGRHHVAQPPSGPGRRQRGPERRRAVHGEQGLLAPLGVHPERAVEPRRDGVQEGRNGLAG